MQLSLRSLLFILLGIFLLALPACSDDLLTEQSAQPSYELNDSDSFNLGVLFNGGRTATQKLMLYNRNSGEIELKSIRLRGGSFSPFRINVDGMAGTAFTNPDLLHIAEGDSLCILMEAAFEGRQEELEVVREDYIDIQCNGRQTSIRLTVTTRNVWEHYNDTITHDTLWQADEDKLLYGSMVIPAGVTLTIDPGVNIFLHDHATIEVYGTLLMQGTLAEPITLRGDRTDKIFDNLYYRDMSAQWGGINFHPGSTGNVMNYADIRGMTTGIVVRQDTCDTRFLAEAPVGQYITSDPKRYAYGPDFLSDERQQLIIRNSLVMNSDSSLITGINANMIIENSCLMNSAGALLEVWGGAYDVTHCTLANYNFWAAFSRCDVVMRNYEVEEETPQPRPLYRCNFTNTLIYGKNSRDPNIDARGYSHFIDEQGVALDSIYNYRLDHCLVRSSSGFDDDDCLSILWSDDPLYRLIDLPNYTVDPHLLPESPCLGKGEPRTLERLPLDRDGKQRAAAPAIGCYEGVSE